MRMFDYSIANNSMLTNPMSILSVITYLRSGKMKKNSLLGSMR
jgi:hypothetical protein